VFTADGRFLLSADFHANIRIWDADRAECVRVLEGDGTGLHSLAVSADGRFVLAAGFQKKYLRIWELDWELSAGPAEDWDEAAEPYLRAFLDRFGGHPAPEQLSSLLSTLQDAGFGRLRTDSVLDHLAEMARAAGR
jgi:WD40 repeat protein